MKITVAIALVLSSIFSISPATISASTAMAASATASPSRQRRVVCVILSVQGSTMTVRKRSGKQLNVDISQAQADATTGIMPLNKPVVLFGFRSTDMVFHVTSIAHSSPEWNDNAPDDDP